MTIFQQKQKAPSADTSALETEKAFIKDSLDSLWLIANFFDIL
jgi:hypothetical protein